MGSHDPIAYTYDADHHCPTCTEERFGRTDDGFIAGQNDDGSESTDSEGNRVGVIAPWDEWCSGEPGCETLVCGDCGEVIDTAHADPHSPDCEDYEAPEGPTPEPGDYAVDMSTGYVGRVEREGKGIDASPDDDTDALIAEQMEREQFWPNVWYVSDHGNWHIHTLDVQGTVA